MRNALQVLAFVIVLAVALPADGLMDTLGPLGYLLTSGPAVAVAGVLVLLSNRPRKKKTALGAATSESGKTSRNG